MCGACLAQCVGKSGAQIVWSSGGAVIRLLASSNARFIFSWRLYLFVCLLDGLFNFRFDRLGM